MNANIRIGHFSPDAPNVNVLVDGETILEDVPFGTTSDFLPVDAGSIDVAVVPAAGGDAVIEAALDVEADEFYTVLAVGELADVTPLILTEDFSTLSGDEARVRVVHTSPDAPAVDVTVRSGPTLFAGIEFGEFSEFATVDTGSYDIDVLPAGGDEALLSLDDLTLDRNSVYTVVATGTLADDSPTAELLVDAPKAGRKVARR